MDQIVDNGKIGISLFYFRLPWIRLLISLSIIRVIGLRVAVVTFNIAQNSEIVLAKSQICQTLSIVDCILK